MVPHASRQEVPGGTWHPVTCNRLRVYNYCSELALTASCCCRCPYCQKLVVYLVRYLCRCSTILALNIGTGSYLEVDSIVFAKLLSRLQYFAPQFSMVQNLNGGPFASSSIWNPEARMLLCQYWRFPIFTGEDHLSKQTYPIFTDVQCSSASTVSSVLLLREAFSCILTPTRVHSAVVGIGISQGSSFHRVGQEGCSN